jgi:hypothetical protein
VYRFITTEKKLYEKDIKEKGAVADRQALHNAPNMLQLNKAIEDARDSGKSYCVTHTTYVWEQQQRRYTLWLSNH